MTRDSDTTSLAPWIELIAAAGDQALRDRILLECALAVTSAGAVALWRPLEIQTGTQWREILARGPARQLPDSQQFEALRKAVNVSASQGGVCVLATSTNALALGGFVGDEEDLDPLSALHCLFTLVEGASDPAVPPALPARALVSSALDEREARRVRHDLANALTSLRATQEMLTTFASGLSSSETAHFQDVVNAECTRAGELLAGAFRARDHAPTLAKPPDSCSPADVLTQAVAAEHALNERDGIRVECLVEPRARSARLALPPADLARVIQNLLVNAREALQGRPNPGIWLTLETLTFGAMATTLRLTVEDDGPGLPACSPERIFESGFTSKTALPGAEKRPVDGQGLSIVRELIERSGGCVRARTRASGGAAFEMTWMQ